MDPGRKKSAAKTNSDMELLGMPDNSSLGEGSKIDITILGDTERELLELVEEGDLADVEKFLQEHPDVDINGRDYQGRSALQIAVRFQHEDLVERFLKVKDIRLGDSLLFAIREGNLSIVEMLLDWQKERNIEGVKDEEFESAEFPLHMMPLMYACLCNDFPIVRLLILRGHKIKVPQPEDYKDHLYADAGETLELSKARVDSYRALASPSYLCLSSEDPILEAFTLSHEAEKLKMEDPVFKKDYEELSQQLRQLAVDLLDECRTSEEVWLLLSRSHDPALTGTPSASDYPRLELALEWDQKEFITHANCQQVLQLLWTHHHPDIMWMSLGQRILYFVPRLLFLPFFYIAYFFVPWLKIWEPWKSPINKFMGEVLSFFVFLGLLIFSIIHGQSSRRVPNIYPEDICIYIWVASYIWGQIKLFWFGGLKAYVKSWWNLYDVVMLVLFVTSFVARFASWIRGQTDKSWELDLERKYWPWWDPMLVSESFYCIAVVLVMGRVLYLFQLSQILGPLQLSLSRMLYDVAQMFFLFLITVFAFSMGMTRLYQYYGDGKRRVDGETKEQPDAFSSWGYSFKTLFWNIFGYGEPENADVIVDNQFNSTHTSPPVYHDFVEGAGYFMYGLYHLIMVTILLNMLIAMMSNTLTHIQENSDVEWKFARSKLWMQYFERSGTLPPPLSVLPSPKSIFRVFLWIKLKCCGAGVDGTEEAKWNSTRCCYIENEEEKQDERKFHDEYKKTMNNLIRRYLHSLSQKEEESHVTPDDLEQLKKDILREIQKLQNEETHLADVMEKQTGRHKPPLLVQPVTT